MNIITYSEFEIDSLSLSIIVNLCDLCGTFVVGRGCGQGRESLYEESTVI